MTKNAKNYRRQILSLTIATVFILGIVAISNTNTIAADVHPITPTGEKIEPYEGYVGQVVPTAVNCNVDSNVVAWVTNNGGTVGDYLTIADDIENNLGVTARNVQLAGSVPTCIVKLVVSHGAAICRGDIGAGPRATIIDWVDNKGGELLILEEHSSCGGGSAALTANWGAIHQGNIASNETYDNTEFDDTHPTMAGVNTMTMLAGTDFISDGTLATVVLDSTNNRPVMLAGPVNSGCVVITGDSNWAGDPSNGINFADNRIVANNVFAFLNECTSDPLEEILKEIKEIWMAIQDEVITLLEGIETTVNNIETTVNNIDTTVNNIETTVTNIDTTVNDISVRDNLFVTDVHLKDGQVMVLLDNAGIGGSSDVEVTWRLDETKCLLLYTLTDVAAGLTLTPFVDGGELGGNPTHQDLLGVEAIALTTQDKKNCHVNPTQGEYIGISTIGSTP